MANIKFYRGLLSKYFPNGTSAAYDSKYKDAVYFATETASSTSGTLYMNGIPYGDGVGSNLGDLNIVVDEDTNTATIAGKDASKLLQYNKTTESDDSATVTKIGGLAAGTTKKSLEGKSLSDIIDMILFEDAIPTSSYVARPLSISASATTVEAGSDLKSLTYTVKMNQGTWTLNGKTIGNYYGPASIGSSSFYINGTPHAIITDNTYTSGTAVPTSATTGQNIMVHSYENVPVYLTETVPAVSGNNVLYLGNARIEQGDTVKTSKGNAVAGSPKVAIEDTSTASITISGKYHPFANTSSISSNGDKQTAIWLNSRGTFEINYKFAESTTNHTDAGRYWVAVPQGMTITKIQGWNPVSNSYDATDFLNNSDATVNSWKAGSTNASLKTLDGKTYVVYYHDNSGKDVRTDAAGSKFQFTVG